MNISERTDSSKAFSHIYTDHFHMVKKFVLINNGNISDAEDLYQDTMIIVSRKLEDDDFKLTAKLSTYIMAIAKNLWYKKLRDSRKSEFVEEQSDDQFYQEVDHFIDNEKSNAEKLLNVLSRISSHCNRLINDIFFNYRPIKEIQEKYGYTTRHNAQNQKHKCIKQMKKEKIKMYG